jgi:hypothetical protein
MHTLLKSAFPPGDLRCRSPLVSEELGYLYIVSNQDLIENASFQ